MLYDDESRNLGFLEQYNSLNMQPLATDMLLLRSITDKSFPGAILPSDDGYYILAVSQKDWNILSNLVKSFLGLTFSNFDGLKNLIKYPSIIGEFLLQHQIPYTSHILIPSSKTTTAEASLNTLYKLYKLSPNNNQELSLYIDKIIDDFKHYLLLHDISSASRIISQIKKENRLDALNIKFMEIELAYSSNNWDVIVNDNLINQIINTRKPLRIRLHIIEAFYFAYLSSDLNDEEVTNKYRNDIRSNISSLFFNCPANATDEVKLLFILAYLNNDIKVEEIDNIKSSIDENNLLSENQQSKLRDKILEIPLVSSKEIEKDNKYISARAAVINANNTDTIGTIQNVCSKLDYLVEKEQTDIIKDSIHLNKNKINLLIPENWIEWINYLSDESFKNSGILAENALEEWPVDKFICDPVDVKKICDAILSIETDIAMQRFIYSLPLYIESFKRSKHFPNVMFLPMYMSVLEIITLHDIQDKTTLITSQDIVTTILQLSPNKTQYFSTLEMLDSIVDKTNGKNFINWLLDYAELIISENSPDTIIRDKTLTNILTKIYDQKDWLEEYQFKFILKLSSLIGIQELFSDIDFEKEEVNSNPWDKYQDKIIGIYTLSESAGRHAKEFLEENIKNVKILLNHDKAATTALKHMANASDYLVLVTQAAKHAATGEIQKILRLKGKDPLFPIGKGSSSIISSLLND
jgi:hypothetical protein